MQVLNGVTEHMARCPNDTTTNLLCKVCKRQPAHVIYGSRCEDCYAEGSPDTGFYRMLFLLEELFFKGDDDARETEGSVGGDSGEAL